MLVRLVALLQKSVRARYIADNLIWLWLAVAAMLTLAAFIVTGGATAAGGAQILHAYAPFDWIWNIGFGLSGALIVYGVSMLHKDIEAVGLMIFGGSLLIYAIALAVAGVVSASLFTYPALLAAALVRVVLLVTQAKIIQQGESLQVLEKEGTDGSLYAVALPGIAALVLGASGAFPLEGIFVLVAALFGSGGYAAWRLIRPQRERLRAESANLITEAADRIILRQQSEIDALKERITQLETKVLHQQETDMAFAACAAERDAANRAIARLDHRVNTLTEVLQNAGVRVPSPPTPQGPAFPA